MLRPFQPAIRRLEERRVLDVSAAFATATGQLEIVLSNSADTATVTVDGGNLVITDRQNQTVAIQIDGGDTGTVSASNVDSLSVHGDGVSDQVVVLDSPLALPNGLFVDAEVETAEVRGDITRVDGGDIQSDAALTRLGADLEVRGHDVVFRGQVELISDVSISGVDVTFEGLVDDDGLTATSADLVLNASGTTRFATDVGSRFSLTSLKTDAAGRTELGGDVHASGNSLVFLDPVTLTGNVSLTDTGSTGIYFGSTIDSAADGRYSLTLSASNGSVTFNGSVGDGAMGDQRLGGLEVLAAANGVHFGDVSGVAAVNVAGDIDLGVGTTVIGGAGIVLNGGAGMLTIETWGGEFRVNGPLVLATDVSIRTSGGNLVFTSHTPIDSEANQTQWLSLDAGVGAVFLNEDIGANVALRGLTVVSAQGGVTFGQADSETIVGTGPVAVIQSVDAVIIGEGANNIAGGIVFNAGTGQTVRLTTTGDDVWLNGPVILASGLSIDTGAGPGSIHFATGTLNSAAGETNDLTLNAGTGGVTFSNDIGASDPLGALTIERADGGVVFGTADVFAASTGSGPAAVIRVSGPIDLGVGANDITGAGIVLNGGTAGRVTLESFTADVRLNGAVTLDTDVAILAGGDITFTNDAPIDSRTGELHDLTLTAAAGAISFNEDVGRATALDSLIVVEARDGVIVGGAISEFPGTGGLGPVEVMRLEGSLDFGSSGNVIGGVGIVLSGSAIAPLRITTTDDVVRFHGTVTLATDVSVATGIAGADILFTSAASIDSAAGRTGGLMLDAGSARVLFGENIGQSRALGSLTITRADGGVFFGTASVESPGVNDLGPVTEIRTDQPIDIGVGTNFVAGGIYFQAGSETASIHTSNDQVRLNGPVRLQSDLSIDTGDGIGDVIFTSHSTIDSSDGPGAATNLSRQSLRIDAGDGSVFFHANVGEGQALEQLTIDRAAAGVVFGGGNVPAAGGVGPVTLVRAEEGIDLGDGATLDDVIGSIFFNGGTATLVLETLGGGIRVNGASTFASPVSMITRGGDVIFTSAASIDSETGETSSLELTLGSGSAEFQSSLGATHRLGVVTVNSATNVRFASQVAATRVVQIAGAGSTIFDGDVNTNDATQAGLDLTGNHFIFRGAVLTTGDGRVRIQHAGTLDFDPFSSMRLAGSFDESGSGHVELAGSLATSGQVITFHSPVVVTDGAVTNVLLSTVAGGIATGADIRFAQTVDGQTAGLESMLFHAGTAGDIVFEAAVGNGVRLGDLTIVVADDVTFTASLRVQRVAQFDGRGTTFFQGPVDLSDASLAAIDIRTVDVILDGRVETSGQGDVLVTVSGSLWISDAADMFLNGAFRQLGAGTVRIAGDIHTTGDDIAFDGDVTLTANVMLDSTAGAGDVVFQRSVNGTDPLQQDLTIRTGTGDVSFHGDVGDVVALRELLIVDAANVLVAGQVLVASFTQQGGSGETRILGNVILQTAGGMVRVENRDITINGVFLAGDNSTVIRAHEDIVINGTLTTTHSGITLDAGDDIVIGAQAWIRSESREVDLSAGTSLAGSDLGEIRMADGARIEALLDSVRMASEGDVVVASVAARDLISIHSTLGGVIDGGDASGGQLSARELSIEAFSGVGRDNLLETSVSILAVSNLGSGGIRISNDVAGMLIIGQVDGIDGLTNGGTGAAGSSKIEIINFGSLTVASAIRNRDGGDTFVRAELPGDLIVDAPIQNTRGDGFISLYAGGDLIIHDSLPEPPPNTEYPSNPEQFFEILVEGEGGVRGQAVGEVIVDDGNTNYVIIHTATGQITNVGPLLSIAVLDQGGSDLDEQGRGFIQITLGDQVHLESNYHIVVDWGDGVIESYPIPGTIDPARDPGNQDPRFVSGISGTQGVYVISHKYLAPPNPDDPAAPIPVHVELRYDARDSGRIDIDETLPESGSPIFNGIVFYRNTAEEIFSEADEIFTNPGTGQTTFIKIVESVIEPVEIRETVIQPPIQAAVSFASSTGAVFTERARRFDAESVEEYQVFMVVVDDILGEEGERIPLSITALRDPVSVFRGKKFPNGHYRIYIEEIRTQRVRLLLDVHIFNSQVVPPNFREGTGVEQPGAREVQPAPAPQPGGNASAGETGDAVAVRDRATGDLPARFLADLNEGSVATGWVAEASDESRDDRIERPGDTVPSFRKAARLVRRLRHPE